MKICDVVVDSIWYDPRVKKQIISYVGNNCDLVCVGIIDYRYNEEEINKIPCKVELVDIKRSKKRNLLTKFIEQLKVNIELYKKIVETKPDIIHANDLTALIPAYYASKKLKCKLIYDTHEIWTENIDIVDKKLLRYYYCFFEKKIIKKVNLVVSVSNAAAQYLKEKYKIPMPMVVTNCIDKARQITDFCKKAPEKQLLNHGQFYAGRGYDILVDSAEILKEYDDLEIVLRGFGPMEKELRQTVIERGSSNVVFAPPVRVEELVSSAAQAWVAVAITEPINLNFRLSVSNKLFEYAAAGLPVIMSDIPEHRYLNEKYKFGIIIEKDTPVEIKKAVDKFYTDQEFYKQCAVNALKMSEEINWDNEFEKLFQYEKALIEKV